MTSRKDGALPAAATWGLLAAWAIHDAEELATMGGWLDRARPRLRARFPQVPERVWDQLRVSPAQARIAIGAMGVVMAAAAARGARTGGRSGFYQSALVGFGLHAGGHVAQAVVTRGYTPGVVTAPLVVAPFSLWAWRRLRAAGVPQAGGGAAASAALLLPLVAGACHAVARILAPERPR
ncbi:HXXEE domain-containing protein [Micromonospora sp. NPDC002717]|uniref:HXXEE domain-containing protein n=1 Tax=unclassified Micromonospora TaxID=2617518 RepID=UPI003328CC48